MILLGLHGPMRAGKDTFAAMLIEEAQSRGLSAVRRAFADNLKVSAMRALGASDISAEEAIDAANRIKEDGYIIIGRNTHQRALRITGREYLQWYGTESHRDVFGTDFWVDALVPYGEDWARNFGGADLGVVTDVRFPNEASRIKLYGTIARITRPGTGGDGHASETPLDDSLIDWKVPNSKGLDRLRVHAARTLDLITGNA